MSAAADYMAISNLGLGAMLTAVRSYDSIRLVRVVNFAYLLSGVTAASVLGAQVATSSSRVFGQPQGTLDVLLTPGNNDLVTFPQVTDFRMYAVEGADHFTSVVTFLWIVACVAGGVFRQLRIQDSVRALRRLWRLVRIVNGGTAAILAISCTSTLIIALAVGGPTYPEDRYYARTMLRQNLLFLVVSLLMWAVPTAERRLRLHLGDVVVRKYEPVAVALSSSPDVPRWDCSKEQVVSSTKVRAVTVAFAPRSEGAAGSRRTKSKDPEPKSSSLHRLATAPQPVIHRFAMERIYCDWDSIDISEWQDATGRFDDLQIHAHIGSGGFANVWAASIEDSSSTSARTGNSDAAATTAHPSKTGLLPQPHDTVLQPDRAATDAGTVAPPNRVLVAVKVFERHAYKEPSQVRLLAQELSLNKELTHPHVVRFLGTSLLDGRAPALVMELMC